MLVVAVVAIELFTKAINYDLGRCVCAVLHAFVWLKMSCQPKPEKCISIQASWCCEILVS